MIHSEKPWLKYYKKKINEFSYIKNISLNEMFQNTVDRFSDCTAIQFNRKYWKYKEVSSIVERFASALHQLGFKKGDRLSIMLPNLPHYVFVLFAVLRLGGIAVQVNQKYDEKEIEFILNDSQAEYMVVFENLYPKVKVVQEKTLLKHIVVVGFDDLIIDISERDYHFDSLVNISIPSAPKVKMNSEEEVALLQYTSGFSKGVMLTHKNIMSNIQQVNDFMFKTIDLPHNPKIMSVVPMSHIYGLTCNVFLGISTGCNLIILSGFDVQEVMETVKRHKPFYFAALPTMLVALNNQPKLEEYGFNKVPHIFCGGSLMSIEQQQLFEKRTGCSLREGYDLAEASPLTHFNPPFLKRKIGSIGIPIPSVDAKIVRKTFHGYEEVPVGEIGELIVNGPQIMKGYWNRPVETKEAIKDGWLHTGDLARMDEDGYFYIVDPKRDLFIACGL